MLLTRAIGPNTNCDLAGINAMELLINSMLKLGATRKRLEAKLFGGAQMIDGLSDIGAQNSAFAIDFLAREGITCRGKSLGGDAARHILFWPATGVARQKMKVNVNLMEKVKMPEQAEGNGLELF